MRLSRYWFRTRSEKGLPKTNISLHPKTGYKIRCLCVVCNQEFNTTYKDVMDVDNCRGCRSGLRARTLEARNRSSLIFSKYYADENNRKKASIIANERYKDLIYKEKHRQASKQRSVDPVYKIKLMEGMKRRTNHAIKTSCGKQGISVDEFVGFISNKDNLERGLFRNTTGKECLQKANFTCVICFGKTKIQVHHKDGWHWCIERRFDLANLVCLCYDCHRTFHHIYGISNNTEVQYNEFVENINSGKIKTISFNRS